MRAHALALDRQARNASTALDAAESALTAATGMEHAEWITRFDEGGWQGRPRSVFFASATWTAPSEPRGG